MIAFILKSTISFFVIYIIYKTLLTKENIPIFKRYFLLFGILFSVIVSIINIKADVQIGDTINHITVNSQIQEISSFNSVVLLSTDKGPFYIKVFLYSVYFFISLLLLFRYIRNLKQLVDLRKNNQLYMFEGYRIVILEQNTSPFSFLKTIFLSKDDYNGGIIKEELLLHELAHVKQNHSIDILLIEFLQVVFWFNPLIWLYKKEMRLNHEYLADKQVISSGIDICDYQKTLLSSVFRNNSSYLASNFNYSFIKKRFIMLSKERSTVRAFIKATVIVPIIALFAIIITFSQEAKAVVKLSESAEWWQTILQKHNVKKENIFNDYGNLFEMGEQISVCNNVTILTNATLIIKGNDNVYMFIQANRVEHNIKDGTLNIKSGTLNVYKMDTDISQPIMSMVSDDLSINLKDEISLSGYGNPVFTDNSHMNSEDTINNNLPY